MEDLEIEINENEAHGRMETINEVRQSAEFSANLSTGQRDSLDYS
jgi:hypothetical protein